MYHLSAFHLCPASGQWLELQASGYLGPPVVPFYRFLFWGRGPLLKSTEKVGTLMKDLSTGEPSVCPWIRESGRWSLSRPAARRRPYDTGCRRVPAVSGVFARWLSAIISQHHEPLHFPSAGLVKPVAPRMSQNPNWGVQNLSHTQGVFVAWVKPLHRPVVPDHARHRRGRFCDFGHWRRMDH